MKFCGTIGIDRHSDTFKLYGLDLLDPKPIADQGDARSLCIPDLLPQVSRNYAYILLREIRGPIYKIS